MTYLRIDLREEPDSAIKDEFIVTNPLGGYCSTTLSGCNTRKYHGLFVISQEKLDGAGYNLLSSLGEQVIIAEQSYDLNSYHFPDYTSNENLKFLSEFLYDEVPTFQFDFCGNKLLKRINLLRSENRLLIEYDNQSDQSIKLNLRPFLAFREKGMLTRENTEVNTSFEHLENGASFCLYENFSPLTIQTTLQSEYNHCPQWYKNFEFREEKERGYEFHEDLMLSGILTVKIPKGEKVYVSIGTNAIPVASIKRKWDTELSKISPITDFSSALERAGDQFLVKKDGRVRIIAGYPWFGPWGRDTFIALPGLTLARGNEKMCTASLNVMAKDLYKGLLPNVVGETSNSYNTVDAPLLFIRLVQQLNEFRAQPKEIWEKWGGAIKEILNNYKKGTLFNIHMTSESLIYAGENGVALTWMDAVIHGRAITPRIGMPVEINALWYNAVCFALELAKINKDKEFVLEWKDVPEKIKTSFLKRFWNEERGYLADIIAEGPDWSFRPNQIIALSLSYSIMTKEMSKRILQQVKMKLLTPKGLRTLSIDDASYIGNYQGSQEKRDEAYHQGTVWPWLFGPYAEAWLRAYGEKGKTHIQEIYDNMEVELFQSRYWIYFRSV